MPTVGYYPGCSLEATARDYAESIAGVAGLLDLELAELPDWNCCGATAGHGLDHRAALNLGARNLKLAALGPQPLVVPCALCFNRLKSAQAELAAGGDRHLAPAIAGLPGDPAAVAVVELNRYLTSPELIARTQARQKQDLSGLTVVCYYGCQGQRPPRVTGVDDPENPTGLDRLLAALGARVLDWPHKTDCCGASHTAAHPEVVLRLAGRLMAAAAALGADALVTGCQMCQANLDLDPEGLAQAAGLEAPLPTFYFTELLGLALGHRDCGRWLGRHVTSPAAALTHAGLPRELWE